MDLPLPFILAIGVAAGIWGLVLAVWLPTLYACLAFLLSAACFGVSYANWDIGAVTVSVDRLGMVLLVLLAGLKRLLTRQPLLRVDRIDWLLAGLMLLLGISVWTQPASQGRSVASPTPTYLFVASYLFPALVFWVVRYRRLSPNDLRLVLFFFVIFGVYLALTAICESHGLSELVFPRYILRTRTLYPGRAVGPFMSAPALGTWLTVATVCSVLVWSQVRGVAKALVALAVPLFAYAEYLTRTRSAWLGFVAAVPLAAWLAAGRDMKQFVIVGVVIVALMAGLFGSEEFLFPKRAEGRGVVAHSTSQRLALAQISLSLFLQRPLLGWGFGQFEHVSALHGGGGPLKLVPSSSARGVASHNVFLRFFAETGAAGASLLLALIVTWLVRASRMAQTLDRQSPHRYAGILFLASFVAYAAEGMFHDVTFISQDNILMFFLAGLVCSYVPIRIAQPTCVYPDETRRHGLPIPARAFAG